MRFPAKSLKAVGGEMYAHLFENQLTGLKRGLYWSLTIHFAPLEYAESNFVCSMTCEWIPWTMRDWRELDGETLNVVYGPDRRVENGPPIVEASFYMSSHDPAQSINLKLKRSRGTKFLAKMDMLVDFHGYDEGDADPKMPVSGETEIDFRGVIVVKSNLSPKPTTEAKLIKVADEFIDLKTYHPPIDEEWRWIIPPKAFRS